MLIWTTKYLSMHVSSFKLLEVTIHKDVSFDIYEHHLCIKLSQLTYCNISQDNYTLPVY